jgi:hypothetical protein
LVEGIPHGSGNSSWGIILTSHKELALSDVQNHGDKASCFAVSTDTTNSPFAHKEKLYIPF